VCSFKRVFDTEPEQEVLTLAELVACFRRFELKPQLFAKIERECGRIDRALEQALAGDLNAGERVSAIREVGDAARARGEDPRPSMRAKAEELKHYARKDAKKDLRLWSPVKYRDGWKERGSEGVTHVTCLVLDYDAGVRIPESTSVWSDFFHMVHTTWSHTPARGAGAGEPVRATLGLGARAHGRRHRSAALGHRRDVRAARRAGHRRTARGGQSRGAPARSARSRHRGGRAAAHGDPARQPVTHAR
jgi:hypothetical protein